MIADQIIPLSVGGVWHCLFLEAHAPFHAFRERYPQEAHREIPFAFSKMSHPGKFFYFLRKRARVFLESKHDKELLEQRTTVIRLLMAALGIPFMFMLLMVCFLLVLNFIRPGSVHWG